MKKPIARFLGAALMALLITACAEKKDTGDKVEDAIKSAGDKVGGAADKAVDKTEDAAKKVKDKAEDATH
jgi:hypothetical protein